MRTAEEIIDTYKPTAELTPEEKEESRRRLQYYTARGLIVFYDDDDKGDDYEDLRDGTLIKSIDNSDLPMQDA